MNQQKYKAGARIPLWLLVALGALLLGTVFFSRDYRRERDLLHNIFLQRGELLIHSLEMVGRMRGEAMADSLGLFWDNLEEDESVRFMAITDERGQILAMAGAGRPGEEMFRTPPPEKPENRLPRWRLARLGDEPIYLVYRPFQPLPRMRGMRHNNMMMWGRGHGPHWRDEAPPPPRYVWVAFNMAPFEAASHQRMRTAAIFALLFCLAGLGGVLAIFWAHNSRLSRRMYEDIRAELATQRRLATLGGLAAGLAHEIRNPLGAIRGLSQHLLGKGTGDPADRETLEVMLTSVDRLNSTITDFLDYARPTEIKPQKMDVAELLRKLNTLAAHDARERAVEVALELPPEPVMINGDESRLSQAFLNIYLNAIQASSGAEGGGFLAVHLERTENQAIIKFQDNGPGFSPEQLAQAFVPYFTTKAEGTGLGLALVEKCVTAHKGAEITLSNAAGGGALVTVCFPVENT